MYIEGADRIEDDLGAQWNPDPRPVRSSTAPSNLFMFWYSQQPVRQQLLWERDDETE